MPWPVDKTVVVAAREIARQITVVRAKYPSLSTNDVFDAIGWANTEPRLTALTLARMHRQRRGPIDLRLPRKG